MSTLSEKENIYQIIVDNKHLIDQLRQRFFEEKYNDNKDFYDQFDIQRIQKSDWQIWRFLRPEKYNIDMALERMDRGLKWRKDMTISSRRPSDAPREFYQIGGIFPYGKDKNGTFMIFMRVKVNLKVPKLAKYVKDFIACVLGTIDQQTNEEGFVLVFDFTGAGLRNADLDLLSYIISVLRCAYPEGMRYCLVYNLPWILRKFWAIVKSWLPPAHQDLVRFANGDEIKNFADSEQLPKYLGGTCSKNFTDFPEGCKSVEENFQDYGFTQDEINKYHKLFEDYFIEAQQLNE